MKFGRESSYNSKFDRISLWQVASIHPKEIGLFPNLSLTFSNMRYYIYNLVSSSFSTLSFSGVPSNKAIKHY